jgi:subtilisin-like proprotein convertase family protein
MPRSLTLFVVLMLTVGTVQLANAQAADVAPPSSEVPELLPPGPINLPSNRGGVLYDNGPYVNSPGTGPGGSDESLLQTALSMTIFGFGHACTAGFRVADEFVVPAGGWDIDEVIFYSYQTGSTTTSTMTGVQLQIWDGAPGVGTIVFGDMTTNRLTGTTWDNAYRRTDTTPGTTRPVMENTVAADVTLPAGTYWLDWCTLGSLASGPWAVPITINGMTNTGNAQQFNPTPAPGAWGPALDTTFPQGFPFLVIGSAGGPTVNTYPSTDTPLPIADGTGNGTPGPPTVSVITVPPSPNEVIDVDVQLTMDHSWAGDLHASLAHAAATADGFYNRPGVAEPPTTFGCSGDDPILTVDDEGTGGTVEGSCTNTAVSYPPGVNYTPNTPLSVFDGLPVDGTWTLTVTDRAGGDTGSLTSWAIIVTEDNTVNAPGSPTAGEVSLRALPNPMSGQGQVELTVPVAQQVRVAVYDMLGREVVVLLDRTLSESQRALMSIEAGRLTPGAYVIRAVGETFETSQRVTITR